jgi:hypothetical protein
MFLAAAFYIPMSGIACMKYQERAVERHFESYLSAHRCVHTGIIVTGYAAEQCDRWERCSSEGEVEEDQYFCRATGKRITFKQFSSGSYGSSAQ